MYIFTYFWNTISRFYNISIRNYFLQSKMTHMHIVQCWRKPAKGHFRQKK